jgi:ABC-2 type transport system ATP-binding protein
MSEATIEVSGLRKRFGSTLALDGMTFAAGPGQVTGFIGPNGAGKSTTMRVILGLGARRVDEVLAQAGLEKAARRKAGGYSLGMRQRLGIAAALLGDPPVLMLDEPFNGMDPEGTRAMRGFLAALAAQGRAVLVSSHLMSELQETAGHLVIVGRGTVIADTCVADMIASASADRIRVRTSARWDAMAVLSNAGAGSAERITALLGERKVPFSEVSAHKATLEEAYMELTRDAVEYRAEPARGAA